MLASWRWQRYLVKACNICNKTYNTIWNYVNKGKSKVQGLLQSQTPALLRHNEEEETDITKQAQIEQTYEKH